VLQSERDRCLADASGERGRSAKPAEGALMVRPGRPWAPTGRSRYGAGATG
jgi:hypothetical protein